jgi:hypothetical protein
MAGIKSRRLAPEVAAAWKKRVAVRVNSKGVEVARSNRHAVLVAVRTFYLPVPKGLDRQRRVPDAGPRPAVAAAFELCAVAVEHPARGDQPRPVLEARKRKDHLVVDQHQAGMCGLGAALKRQGHLPDLDDAARRRDWCEVVSHRYPLLGASSPTAASTASSPCRCASKVRSHRGNPRGQHAI